MNDPNRTLQDTAIGLATTESRSPDALRRLDGPDRAIVLLHGWGHHAAMMLPMASLFRELGTCYLPDLPGFGQAPPPPSTWGTIDYARWVVRLLDEQGISRADFIGHSFGGRLIVQLSAHFPERVRSAVLIAGAGLRPVRSWRAAARVRSARWLGNVARQLPAPLAARVRSWRERKFGSADFRAASRELRPILSRVVQEDLQNEARQVRAPTLLLYGRHDTATPVEMGERFNNLIRGSRLIVLEAHGHNAFLGGGAHLCATYVKRFYADVVTGVDA